MTIGDVLAVVAGIGVAGVGAGALLIFVALAFPARAAQSAEILVAAPGKCLLRGLGWAVGVSIIAILFRHSHAGPVRLLGAALWVGLLVIALIGGAGIARLLGERIQSVGTDMTPFASVTRGAALCVLAGLFPVIGWFVVVPIAALMSLGSASVSLRRQAARGSAETQAMPLTAAPLSAGEA